MNICEHCRHTRDQHAADGFCDVEDATLGYCPCPGYEEKKEHVT